MDGQDSNESGRGRVLVAAPLGFCAGVERAIGAVERAVEEFDEPVYVRGQIVHSEHVVEALAARGARFVTGEEDVPEGGVCVFSAHGVGPDVRRRAAARNLRVIDATCPLVAKVHVQVRRYAREGRAIVLIGRRGHEEVDGTAAEAPEHVHVVATEEEIDRLPIPADAPVAYSMQTTLAVDDAARLVARLRERFTDLAGPRASDICYATQNRQAAVRATAAASDVVLIAGARNSSNCNRLVEVARAEGVPAHLVPAVPDLDPAVLEGARVVGLGAGASTPRALIDGVLARLQELGFDQVEVQEVLRETVKFPAPRQPA